MDIDVTKLPVEPDINVGRLFATVYLASSPQTPAFKGFVRSVSSQNQKGYFDILQAHENFVSPVVKSVTILPEEGPTVNYNFGSGVIEVANNVIRIFLKN